MVRLSSTRLTPGMMVVPRLLMLLGLIEHRSLEDLVAEVAKMVATVVAEVTVAMEVDTVEAAVMMAEEVVEEEVSVFSVVSLATLLGSVPKLEVREAVVATLD
ncbi:hypothetical protein H5410_007751 [Solanum commersonii]|uniref:Uncharacterized protein n=1 Tax=Solanum commersonii TaxID=4109 RepID=A0A9J6AD09_SOLCO|nr:hypothetical protein H5410_007751 [Solanum commersonii]